MIYPVKNHKVTCAYGVKGSWKCGFHCGVDLIPSDGSDYNIYAPVKATVFTTVLGHSSYGNYIVLKHGGYFSRYAHLKSIGVKKGQSVNEGDVIGVMGSTGNSTGRHLHFEVHKGASMAYPANTDPTEFLKKTDRAEYSFAGGIHTVKIPAKDFKIVMWDKKKKTSLIKNYANAGFFAGYKENKEYFTLPVGLLKADINGVNELVLKYIKQFGRVVGGKCCCDNNNNCSKDTVGYAQSTLTVKDGRASIGIYKSLPDCDYAVSGVPVMAGGKDVSYSKYVRPQGWSASSLYATKHIFLGLKGDGYIYLTGIKTKTSNCIQSSEVYRLLEPLGFRDVIKLDGGGSTVIDCGGKNVFATAENRQINNLIMW